MESFNKRQFVNVKDLKYGKLYRAKVMVMNEEWQAVKVHYVGWNNRYEVIPLSSSRIEKW